MSREKQIDEVYRPMNEDLFNNLEKQYRALAEVKSESEQIEEMAKAIVTVECIKKPCEECKWCGSESATVDCTDYLLAEHLYNAGYRKQSDVAEKILYEIEELFSSPEMPIGVIPCLASREYEELKKKHTEGQT